MNMRDREYRLKFDALESQLEYLQHLNETGAMSDESYQLQADSIIAKAKSLRNAYEIKPKNTFTTPSIKQLVINYNSRLQ